MTDGPLTRVLLAFLCSRCVVGPVAHVARQKPKYDGTENVTVCCAGTIERDVLGVTLPRKIALIGLALDTYTTERSSKWTDARKAAVQGGMVGRRLAVDRKPETTRAHGRGHGRTACGSEAVARYISMGKSGFGALYAPMPVYVDTPNGRVAQEDRYW